MLPSWITNQSVGLLQLLPNNGRNASAKIEALTQKMKFWISALLTLKTEGLLSNRYMRADNKMMHYYWKNSQEQMGKSQDIGVHYKHVSTACIFSFLEYYL